MRPDAGVAVSSNTHATRHPTRNGRCTVDAGHATIHPQVSCMCIEPTGELPPNGKEGTIGMTTGRGKETCKDPLHVGKA
eukprot:scaffold177_cov334-Pavlova_lutheri.AAC.105